MAEYGDKYIIEVGAKYMQGDGYGGFNIENTLYGIKGFNSLVFDENGLSKLEKYEESPFTQEDCDRARKEGYEQGLNDVWEAARKIGDADRKSDKEFRNYLVGSKSGLVEELLSPAEAISKIKAYDEQKKAEEEIKVGDEITWEYKGENNRAVITYICDHYWDVICEDGRNYAVGIDTRKKCTKTGRHFDIDGILKAMREE